jgi:hypothetical protein
MPIKNLTERRVLPRLGKIKLGVKVNEPGKKEYSKATDYFVCPPEVKALYGEQPKVLPIMFPVDDPEQFFPQFNKMYRAAGLWCKGDGETAQRFNAAGALESRPCPCEYLDPTDGSDPQCFPTASLAFCLPAVQGVGVYQIVTRNRTSIVGLNSAFDLFRKMFGGLRGIPFQLVLEPQTTERFDPKLRKMVKTTLHCLRLATDRTLLEVIEWRRGLGAPVDMLMLPEPEEEEAPPPAAIEPAEAAAEASPAATDRKSWEQGTSREDVAKVAGVKSDVVGPSGAAAPQQMVLGGPSPAPPPTAPRASVVPPAAAANQEEIDGVWQVFFDAAGQNPERALADMRARCRALFGRVVEGLQDLDGMEIEELRHDLMNPLAGGPR